MRGVKRIAGILERLAVVSLPPAVEPDRHEGKQRKPLLAQLDLTSEERDRIHLPAEHHHVEPVQRRELPEQAPPLPLAEKVIESGNQSFR